MIDFSIEEQTANAHLLLLRLETNKITKAVMQLDSRVIVRDDDVKKDANEFKNEIIDKLYKISKRRRSPFNDTTSLNQAMINKTIRPNQFDLPELPVRNKKKRSYYNYKKEQNIIRTLETIPEKQKNNRISWIVFCICMMALIGLILVRFAHLWQTYTSVKPKLNDMARMGILSTAFFFTQSEIFIQLLNVNSTDVKWSDTYKRLYNIQEASLTVEDEYIRSRLSQTMVCPYLSMIPASLLVPCYKFSGFESNFSVQQAIHTIQLKIKTTASIIKDLSYQARKEKIEEQDLAWQEMLTIFTSICIRMLNEELAQRFNSQVSARLAEADIILYILIICLFGCTLCFKLYWIRYKLKYWNQTMKLLRILEDQILDNEYIKAYFGFRYFSVFE
jgi:hypothetical protein